MFVDGGDHRAKLFYPIAAYLWPALPGEHVVITITIVTSKYTIIMVLITIVISPWDISMVIISYYITGDMYLSYNNHHSNIPLSSLITLGIAP